MFTTLRSIQTALFRRIVLFAYYFYRKLHKKPYQLTILFLQILYLSLFLTGFLDFIGIAEGLFDALWWILGILGSVNCFTITKKSSLLLNVSITTTCIILIFGFLSFMMSGCGGS